MIVNQSMGAAVENQINRLKNIGITADIDGFVCSPSDIQFLSNSNKLYVTPGIRLDKNTDDHHKVWTPVQACSMGACYLVIGRSITNSKDPNSVLEEIIKSL